MKSRVVVITGGTSGIGRALCDCFAKANYQIVLAARSEDKLKKVQKELSLTGTQILVVKTDVRLEEDCKNLAAETINCYGQIDVLINNAGITWYESDNDGINISKQRDLIDTNFFGTVNCTKHMLPHLLDTKGSLVGVCSIAGEVGLPNRSAYSSSKFAMNGFLSSLRVQHIKKGLHVLVVFSGYTSTNIRKSAIKDCNSSGFPPGYGGDVMESNMLSAEETARHIFNGVKYRKRALRPTFVGKVTVLLNKLIPHLNDRLLHKYYK